MCVLKALSARANGLSSDNHMMFPMQTTNTRQWAVYLMWSHHVHDRGGNHVFYHLLLCGRWRVITARLSYAPFVAHTALNVHRVSLKF